MIYGKDIISYTNTMEYYANEIISFVQKQIEEDLKANQSVDPRTIRFDCFGAIASACETIKIYCKGIEVNTKSAESQDSKLKQKEELGES